MASLLSKLLCADEPFFGMTVIQMENVAGHPGVDIKLISEMIQKSQNVIRQLGLDAVDSTGPELYQVLQGKIATHDNHLKKHIGAKEHADINDLLPYIREAAIRVQPKHEVWTIKRSVAKRFLQKNPPRNVMKLLNYTSVDSMIKRENLFEIFGALRFIESPAWLKKFNQQYKQLKPSDFESRSLEILILNKERWGDSAENFIKQRHHNVVHLKEMGVILLLPFKLQNLSGASIAILSTLLHYLNEIRLYSAFFKHEQVKPDFGKIIVKCLNDSLETSTVSNSKLNWRAIHQYFGEKTDGSLPDIFAPHIQPEDMRWIRTEELLYKIDPELSFWRGLDYVGIVAGTDPVSLNLLDNSLNYLTDAPYQSRHIAHFQKSLWSELYKRYLGHKILETQALSQLDNSLVSLEKLRIK